MAARVTVGGVDHLDDLDNSSPIKITLLQNGRSRMRARCLSGYTPARFEDVIAYAQDGVTPIYGGVILQRSIEGLIPGAVPSRRPMEMVGFEAYLDWVYLDLSFTADTNLQVALDAFIAELPPSIGIVLDATDYTGVPLAAFTWTNMRASDGLRELCDRTGRVYRVSPLKVLSVPLPGGVAAPVTITDADPHCRDLVWRDPATPPVTQVTLLCGTGTATKVGAFIGTERVDDPGGEYSYFYVPYNVPADLNGIWPNYLNIPEPAIGGPVLWGFNVGAHDWLLNWDYLNHRIVWDRVLGGDFDDAWHIDPFSYTAQYPFTVTATAGGSPAPSPIIEIVETKPEVFELAQAQEIAEGILAASGAQPREAEIISLEHGWAPGQAVVVALTGRAMNATLAVTQVEIDWRTAGYWEYRITAIELSVFPGSYLDQWRALLAGSSGGGGVAVSTGGAIMGNSYPAYALGGSRFHAVQLPAVAP